MSGSNTVPIFVKGLFGRRIIVSESYDSKQCFSLPKETADSIKIASGFSKRKRLYIRYQGKDFRLMEVLNWKSSSLFNHSIKNGSCYIFKDTNRN